MAQLWGGRFTGKTDPLMLRFNASLPFDRRMASVDCIGSRAYAEALTRAGLITAAECTLLQTGLTKVEEEWANGTFISIESDEDIHTANERRLGEIIGMGVAGKLHTGRSRNDQVATDLRLYLRLASTELQGHLRSLILAVTMRAAEEVDILMPGYTHLQRAQPIRWSHFLLSHVWSWVNDLERLEQLSKRFNKCPLGSGALAGNPFQIARPALATSLNFDSPVENSLQAVSDRDFVVEFLGWASLHMIHLSRISEDLIGYCSSEFGFIGLADAYSTGSSLMPQKKNPDSLELIRGKSGRVFGDYTGFMMTYKALPSTYNKDLQEDKEPLFDAIETVSGCMQIMNGVLATLKVNKEKMEAALSFDMLATDLAEYLVRKGVPFRETHHISGQAVRLAEQRSCSMAQLSLKDLQSLNPLFTEDVMQVWNFEGSIEKKNCLGGTAKASVLAQIAEIKKRLATPTI